MNRKEESAKRLTEVAAAYGADPARWPETERHALEAASRAHPAVLAEAAEIDRVLALATAAPDTATARFRLLQAVASRASAQGGTIVSLAGRRRSRLSPAWSWAAVATLAASLVFGIYLGTLDSTGAMFDPGVASNDDPVDLAGLGDVSDYLEDQG